MSTARARARARARTRARSSSQHGHTSCTCPNPTYSTGFLPFPLEGQAPTEDDVVALLRCKTCGRRPPPDWEPGGAAASGAGGAPWPRPAAATVTRWPL